MKLTNAQERARMKLEIYRNEWKSAYDLQESIPTLEGLVSHKVAVSKHDDLGSLFSPRTSIYYKLK
jgi:hypothetical protein